MSKWAAVGSWLKDNATGGAALVGSLITGNLPGAVAAGVSLVASATGSTDPGAVLRSLQADPAVVVRLQELANQDEANIREHLRAMTELEYQDAQASHHETQETIRNGDNADDRVVRWTRPLQSWVSLSAAITYIFYVPEPDLMLAVALFTLPWSYAGLREVGKVFNLLLSKRAGGK